MKLKILKEYLKDIPPFLWFLVRYYRQVKKESQLDYDRRTSYTAFPKEYEEEIRKS